MKRLLLDVSFRCLSWEQWEEETWTDNVILNVTLEGGNLVNLKQTLRFEMEETTTISSNLGFKLEHLCNVVKKCVHEYLINADIILYKALQSFCTFFQQTKPDWSEPELILAVKEYTPKVMCRNIVLFLMLA